MSLLLILAWIAPLLLAIPALHRRLMWSPAIGAVPALAAALILPVGTGLEVPWLLLGAAFGIDEIGRIFLLFTSVLWLVAGGYAGAAMRGDPHASRFQVFFLLAMAGNLWVILSQDLVGFYTGFTLMGIASYGLVIHHGDRRALRAGKVYLVLTLVGELALFAAIILIVATTGSTRPTPAELGALGDLAISLLIFGLAIKAGLVPLHVWLPLAHPAAPIAASAVLSGTMIKVAILGWLRYLPIGASALPDWGLLFIFIGLTTAFFSVPLGLIQSDPKVLLAYSSISKMGLMVIIVGIMLIAPELAPPVAVGLALYAGHHALTKGGLFLGIGLRRSAPGQPLVLLGIACLALSLAAVPLTSGAVAKYGIKPALAGIDWRWLGLLIALTTLATTWLMARLMWLIWHLRPTPLPALRWAMGGWAILPGLVLLYPLVLGSPSAWITDAELIALAALLALPVALLAQAKPAATATLIDRIPAGDLIWLLRPVAIAWRWSGRRLLRAADRWADRAHRRVLLRVRHLAQRPPPDLERQLKSWPTAGALWLAIMAGLIGLSLTVPPPAPPVGSVASGGEETPRLTEPASGPALGQASEPAPRHDERGTAPDRRPARPAESPAAVAAPLPETPAPSDSCDPEQAYLFRHGPSGATIDLTRCVRVDGWHELLVAPALTAPLVRLLQRHLNDLGLDAGPIDGLVGPLTRGAVRRFEQSQGMAPTGAVTFDLLERIQQAADVSADGSRASPGRTHGTP